MLAIDCIMVQFSKCEERSFLEQTFIHNCFLKNAPSGASLNECSFVYERQGPVKGRRAADSRAVRALFSLDFRKAGLCGRWEIRWGSDCLLWRGRLQPEGTGYEDGISHRSVLRPPGQDWRCGWSSRGGRLRLAFGRLRGGPGFGGGKLGAGFA